MATARTMAGLLITALLMLGLGGCDQPAPDGLRFGLASAPLTLDPRFATDAAGERIGRLLFARLAEHDDRGRALPALASWQQTSPTGYRLTLDPDRAVFSDGRTLTAADVVATYNAVLDPTLASPHRDTLKNIRHIEALDASHLAIELTQPDLLLPGRLSLGILPAEQAGQPQRLTRPVGSGLFELLTQDSNGLQLRRRGDGMLLTFLAVADPTVRALKLVRGELDLLQNDLPPEIAGWLGRQSGIHITRASGDTFAYLGFNHADPLTGNLRVRRAIALAVDRTALIRHLFQDGAVPAESVLVPDHWAGHTALVPAQHDPARARRLLAELGYGPGHPLTLSYKTSADPFRLRLAAAIQAQLAAVGIDVQIQSYDWGTFYGDIKAGRFQLYSLAWVGVKEPDILRHIFHSTSLPPGGANRGRYASPLVDLALDAALRANKEADMAASYRTAQEQVHDDLVYVPLWYEQQLVVMGPRVTDYSLRRDGAYDGLATVRINSSNEQPRD